MFKVGQNVICKVCREGVVTKVIEDIHRTHPIEVDFLKGGWACYTKDGKLFEDDDEPSLSVIEE